MWPSILARLLRRRILCLVLLLLLLLFYSFVYFWEHKSSLLAEQSFQRTRPLIWRTLQEHVLSDEPNNRTNDMDLNCRNSIQGRLLLVDDRGFVCSRTNLLTTGCCDVEIPETLYYTCQSCNTTSDCCSVYEYCVSCCLHPMRRPLLEQVLQNVSGRQAAVYAHVADHFELCLVKCRTNSHSVEHENKYRDATVKYCYGLTEAHESQRAVLENAN